MLKKFLMLIAVLCLALGILSTVAAAEVAPGEGISWNLSEDGTLTVSGTGAIADNYDYKSHWKEDYNDQIKEVVVADGITEIGSYAFGGLTKLEKVTIAGSVKAIDYYAFINCESLTTVTMSGDMESMEYNAFRECKALKTVVMPDTLSEMASQIFYGCVSLEEIAIPEGVSAINPDCFYGCTALKSVELPSTLELISSRAFANCTALASIEIPDNVTELGVDAFSGCSALTTLEIPKKLHTIEEGALKGLSSLTEVTIDPENTKFKIYDGGLADSSRFYLYPMKKQGTLTLPENIVYFSSYALNDCTQLTELTILGAPYSFYGYETLKGCTGLTKIKAPYSLINSNLDSFRQSPGVISLEVLETDTYYQTIDGVIYSADGKILHFYPWGRSGAFSVPAGVEEIKSGAFDKATGLTALTLPETLQKFHTTLSDCDLITTLTIPASVTSLYVGAFSGCDALTGITVAEGNTKYQDIDGIVYSKDGSVLCSYPGGGADSYTVPQGITLTEVWSSAFDGNKKIKSVTLPQTVKKFGSNAFRNCSALETITLPDEVASSGGWGSSMFQGCSSLKECIVPVGAKSLGYCFSDCTALTYVRIPDTITSMASAFSNCASLDNLVIPGSVSNVKGLYGCSSLKNLTISEGVKTIESAAFRNCSSLECLTIPSTVTIMYNDAFNGCTSMKDLYYVGTKPQYNKVLRVVSDPFNSPLKNVTVHFIPVSPTYSTPPAVAKTKGNTYTFQLNFDKAAATNSMILVLHSAEGAIVGMKVFNPPAGESENAVAVTTTKDAASASIFAWDDCKYMNVLAEPVNFPIVNGSGSAAE